MRTNSGRNHGHFSRAWSSYGIPRPLNPRRGGDEPQAGPIHQICQQNGFCGLQSGLQEQELTDDAVEWLQATRQPTIREAVYRAPAPRPVWYVAPTARYGNISLPDLKANLTGDCPRAVHVSPYECCKAYYTNLPANVFR